MKKSQSFSLIEAVVSIAIIALLAVAFTPGLTKHQQQVELEAATQQIQNAIYNTRSLAISPNYIAEDGAVMKHYFLILNISASGKTYISQIDSTKYSDDECLAVPGNTDTCRKVLIPAKSYAIFGSESALRSFQRYQLYPQKDFISYPNYISIFYDYPCRNDAPRWLCPQGGSGESYFWKPHFRNIDGMIGYDGRYFDNPDFSGIPIGYWIPELWGSDPRSVTKSNLTIVWGNITSDPETTYGLDASKNLICQNQIYKDVDNLGKFTGKTFPCKVLTVDNITGATNVQ